MGRLFAHHSHLALSVIGQRRDALTVAAVICASTVLSGCGGANSAETIPTVATSSTAPARATTSGAINAGASFVSGQIAGIDAASLTIGDYLARNWGIAELSGAREAARARMASPDLSDDERLLARLVDPTASALDPIAEGAEPTTAVLASALHCDVAPWSPVESEAARTLAEGGGYQTTHAALAVQWMAELRCAPEESGRLRADIIESVADELDRATEVTDLAVEQSSILLYLGAGDRIPQGWSKRVRSVQRSDGGWGPTASNWHMTLLAIWTLAGLDRAGSGVSMVAPS